MFYTPKIFVYFGIFYIWRTNMEKNNFFHFMNQPGTLNKNSNIKNLTFLLKKKKFNKSFYLMQQSRIIHKLFDTNSSFHVKYVHCGKSLISVFWEFFASINKNFILTGRLGSKLLFYEFLRLFWYSPIAYDSKS